jgi:hypothetical protein
MARLPPSLRYGAKNVVANLTVLGANVTPGIPAISERLTSTASLKIRCWTQSDAWPHFSPIGCFSLASSPQSARI